jgi:hypothetical protein
MPHPEAFMEARHPDMMPHDGCAGLFPGVGSLEP